MGVPAPAGVSASGNSPYAGDQANGVVQGTLAAVRAGKPFAFWGPMNLWLWASYTTSLTLTAGSLTVALGAAGAVVAGTSVNSPLVPRGTTLSSTTVMVLPIYTYYGKTHSGIAKITDLLSTDWLLGATVAGLGLAAGITVTAIDTVAVPGQGIKGVVSLSSAPTVEPQNDTPTPFEFSIANTAIAAGVDATAIFTGAGIIFNATVQLERTFDGGATWLPCNIGGSGTLAQWTFAGGGTPVSISFGEPERQVLYRLNALAYTAISGTTLNYRISATGQAAISLSVPTL